MLNMIQNMTTYHKDTHAKIKTYKEKIIHTLVQKSIAILFAAGSNPSGSVGSYIKTD